MTKEIWAKIINDAQWYDGTPQGLVQLTEYFEKQYNITEKSAICEVNSSAVLDKVRALLEELFKLGGEINSVWCKAECSAGEEYCPQNYCLDDKISELYEKVSEHFS